MPEADIAHLVLESLPFLGLPAGSRVLTLSGAGSSVEAHLAAAGLVASVFDPASPLPRVEDPFDGAVIAGTLEAVEWDRWVLQQVRERLKPGAPLLLVLPNLASLASAGDACWLAGRVLGEVSRKTRGRLGMTPRPDTAPFRGRRYSASRVRTLLDRSGFELAGLEPRTGGLMSGPSALGIRPATRFFRHWQVRARSRPADPLGGWVPLSGVKDPVASFERDQAPFVRDRDAWAARHPHAVAPAVRELDPRAHASACAMVFAPHPDDEIIGCGGTILRLVDAGARVVCVQATDGSDSAALRGAPESVRRSVRLDEARAVAAAAGIHETHFWQADNRAFRATPGLVERAAQLFAQHRPRLVFAPFLTDIHPDHLTLNRILAAAIERSGDALEGSQVLGYEVWALAPPSLVCDVAAVRARQEELLWLYTTAMKVDDFIELCERRNHYHACRALGRPGYAEAFHAVPAREYPALVAAAAGA